MPSSRRVFAAIVCALAVFAGVRVFLTLKPPILFAPQPGQPVHTAPIGHIDAICVALKPACTTIVSGQPLSVPANTPLSVRGWAVLGLDPPTLTNGVSATIDGRTSVAGKLGESRPDVARAYNEGLFSGSGFSITLTSGLRAGKHRIDVSAFDVETRLKAFVDAPVQVFAR